MTTNQAKPTELPERIVEAVWKCVERYTNGEIWMDTLRAKAEVKRLLRTPSPAQAEWLPIESAPKDGDDVLLWVIDSSDEHFEIANWRDDAKAWDTTEGWLQGIPTHWMRPQPPKGDDKQ